MKKEDGSNAEIVPRPGKFATLMTRSCGPRYFKIAVLLARIFDSTCRKFLKVRPYASSGVAKNTKEEQSKKCQWSNVCARALLHSNMNFANSGCQIESIPSGFSVILLIKSSASKFKMALRSASRNLTRTYSIYVNQKGKLDWIITRANLTSSPHVQKLGLWAWPLR